MVKLASCKSALNSLVWFCLFPLPLGVWEGLRFVIVALPGLFSYLFIASYVFQRRRRLQYVLFAILNKYFIAQMAKNTFILHWKKVKTGISAYPSPGEIKLKISSFFFSFKPTPIRSDTEMKVVGNSIVRFFKICL